MELDWATALVGIFAVVLCTLPFILDHRSRTKKAKLLLGSLQKIAKQHGCNVDLHEACGRSALGLDERKNALFFFDQNEEQITTRYVDLADVRTCQAVKATRTVKGPPANVIMERVELAFQPKDRSKAETRFELYREGSSAYLNGEVQFADKWARQINERLKGK
jgi:hypothetical protein